MSEIRCGQCGRGFGRPVDLAHHKTACRPMMARLVEKCVLGSTVGRPGCWLWSGAKNPDGYGRLRVDGRIQQAHRVAYEAYVGPILEGLTIDHLCRNPACICPAHLEPVTMKTNILRGEGLAAQNARKTHCKHGHKLAGKNLYVRPNGERECRECSR